MTAPATEGHVFIATSLDGFIARPDGTLDWLTGRDWGGEDHGYFAFIAGMDGIVMGSGTFRTVLDFDPWPYELPVIVASRSLRPSDLPAHLQDKARVSPVSPAEIMAETARQGWTRAYLDGGRLVQAFLREGLVRSLTLSVLPVLLGEGRPLFGPIERDIALRLESSRAFPSGLVQSRYTVAA